MNLVSGIIRIPKGLDFSACIGDRCRLIFLHMPLQIVICYPSDILRYIMIFSERHLVFFVVIQK